MKFKFMLFGIALVLMLCISPVAAVSGSDFETVFEVVDGVDTYKYLNLNNPDEKYTKIRCDNTKILHLMVIFRPANISDAPAMLVYTNKGSSNVFIPKSVDYWEVRYYSRYLHEPDIDYKYLKNKGIVDLNTHFGKYIEKGLILELSWGQFIYSAQRTTLCWDIPDVD